jgi:hypothetical protein
VVLGVGLIYLLAARPADHLEVPAGDAIPRRG